MVYRSIFNQKNQISGSTTYLDSLTTQYAEECGNSYYSGVISPAIGASIAIDSITIFNRSEQGNYIIIATGPATGIYRITLASGTSSATISPSFTGSDTDVSYSRHYYKNIEDDLNYIRTQIKNISGTTNWFDSPLTNISALNSSVSDIEFNLYTISGSVDVIDTNLSALSLYLDLVSGTLQTQINNRAYLSHTHDDRYYTEAEVGLILTTLSGALQFEIDGKAPSIHLHDDRYYTETEIDLLLLTVSGTTDHSVLENLDYSSSGHTGFASSDTLLTSSGVLQAQIDLKSDYNHTHDTRYYTEAEINGIVNNINNDITTISGFIITNHSELSNLSSDDHSQYLLSNGSRLLTNNWTYGSSSISGTGNIATMGSIGIGIIPSTDDKLLIKGDGLSNYILCKNIDNEDIAFITADGSLWVKESAVIGDSLTIGSDIEGSNPHIAIDGFNYDWEFILDDTNGAMTTNLSIIPSTSGIDLGNSEGIWDTVHSKVYTIYDLGDSSNYANIVFYYNGGNEYVLSTSPWHLHSLVTTDGGITSVGNIGIKVASPAYELDMLGTARISGDLLLYGNMTVSGTTFITRHETVEIRDNLLLINSGEVGPGVTVSGALAGIEIDRGTSIDYQFIFDENSDAFKIGEVGSLQKVATREDTPINSYVPYWNSTSSRFDTSASLAISDISTVNYVDLVSGTLQSNINNKSSLGHTHDDRYYTEGETDLILSNISGSLQSNIEAIAFSFLELTDTPDIYTGNPSEILVMTSSGIINEPNLNWNGELLNINGEISLLSGGYVDNISDDSTFTSALDTTLSTQLAIKTYVDNAIAPAVTWIHINANYTASAGENLMLDSTNSAFEITLPPNPEPGDAISFLDVANYCATNNVRLNRNGRKIMGESLDVDIDEDSASFKLVFYVAAGGWRIIYYY